MMSSSLAPSSTVAKRRRTLFFLFCACIILVVLCMVGMIGSGSIVPSIRFPTMQGIYDRIQSWNSSYLNTAPNQIPCKCPPCVTSAPCVCEVIPGSCPTPKSCPPRYTTFLPFKRELNRKLADIHIELKNALRKKTSPTAYILLKLEAIMEELDKSYKHSKVIEVVQEDPPLDLDEPVDVCPEKYLGEKKGYPFFQFGWVTANCTNVRPLPEVLTILLNTVEYPEPYERHVEMVLRGINETYPGVQVYIAPKNTQIEETANKYKNVTAIKVKPGSRLGKVWNQLVSMVRTPYTLVARDVVHFTWTARVLRQIRMISQLEHVGVVGGAFRNWTGHWRVGCRQTKKKNYVLEYEEGYYYSTRSCMFCDDLEGPFVSKTQILKSAEFGEKLPKEVVFEDFFLRVLETGYLVMNCPDVMYITTDYSSETKQNDSKVWRFFSAKWIFARILLPGGIKHSFSCADISYRCRTSVTKYALMPICCLEQYGKAMKFFHDFCIERNVQYELDAGSVLGAVKFSGLIPWDLDGDLSMLSNNFTFVRSFQEYFRQHGFNLNGYSKPKWDINGTILKNRKGYLVYHSPDIYTEINGWTSMSGSHFLPPELHNPVYYTKVLMNNYWVNCMFNPGLFARNRYGLDILKHSQSWLQVGGMGSSWSRYKPGRFLPCKYPLFHGCLDKFPADGNLPFKVA